MKRTVVKSYNSSCGAIFSCNGRTSAEKATA